EQAQAAARGGRQEALVEAAALIARNDGAAPPAQRVGVLPGERKAQPARDPVDERREEQESAAEEPDRAFIAEAELEEEAVGRAGGEHDRDRREDRRGKRRSPRVGARQVEQGVAAVVAADKAAIEPWQGGEQREY